MNSKATSRVNMGDIVIYGNREYIVVGLSNMIYDETCEGEPELKITKELQEVAIADKFNDISYQKPCWLLPNLLQKKGQK